MSEELLIEEYSETSNEKKLKFENGLSKIDGILLSEDTKINEDYIKSSEEEKDSDEVSKEQLVEKFEYDSIEKLHDIDLNDRYLLTLSDSESNDLLNGDANVLYKNLDYQGLFLNDPYGLHILSTTMLIIGTSGNDNLVGTDLNDTIYGYAGNDNINGRAGNDNIHGGDGDDIIEGHFGDDIINGGTGNDVIYGSAGNDIISSMAGSDDMFGDDGDDKIIGAGDSEWISGGVGNDKIYADGDCEDYNNESGDQVFGGEGDDIIVSIYGNDWLVGGAGNDNITGGRGNDHIYGQAGADFIMGRDGNDIIEGGNGNDALDGGNGNDIIYGDDEDLLSSAIGGDVIYGRDGNDEIHGGGGGDLIYGGNGIDVIYGDAGNDTIYGGAGDDLIANPSYLDYYAILPGLLGGDGNDVIYGGDGIDSISGGDGNDVMYGGDGIDFIDGGDGKDFVDAGNGDDVIVSDGGNDDIYCGLGNDLVWYYFSSSSSTDSIAIHAGSGNDYVIQRKSEAGNSFVFGEDGDDVIICVKSGQAFNAPYDTFKDYIDGGNGNDIISGGFGNDTIIGGSGNDLIFGDALVDPTFPSYWNYNIQLNSQTPAYFEIPGSWNLSPYTGLTAEQILSNAPGATFILGADGKMLGGNDIIQGGDGNDTILDVQGVNVISGGAGADVFYFDNSGTRTTGSGFITEFEIGLETVSSYYTDNYNFNDCTSSSTITDFELNIDILRLSNENQNTITTVWGGTLISSENAALNFHANIFLANIDEAALQASSSLVIA